MKRFWPHPYFSLLIIAFWLLLQKITLNQVLLSLSVGWFCGLLMARLEPSIVARPRFKPTLKLASHFGKALIVDNARFAYQFLKAAGRLKNSGFIIVKLRLNNRHGVAWLAVLVASTPGTLWVGYNPKTHELLLHLADKSDETMITKQITEHYESPLLEIFP
ncbi:Na+/H+ antiporter subunit E [Bartonella sp. DGB2]|uniref:Na+/H+ antiporter subunit E n=1 Tax=Bartonella sp. DGB2 TaxID=3388426 RepID=UPI00398FE155